MADILKRAEIVRTLVMCGVNKKGYFMNPGRKACEEEFSRHSHAILAMSPLAAGSLKPEEAFEYIASLGTVKHIVVGLSSKEHADETFRIARKYFTKA
jgi:predicted aldo/keto reductase-like oxidoreductase